MQKDHHQHAPEGASASAAADLRDKSVSLDKCSHVMRKLLLDGLDKADVASGWKECVEIMEKNDYAGERSAGKRGRIVMLLRSYGHAAFVDSSGIKLKALKALDSKFCRWPRDLAISKVKKFMEKKLGEDTKRGFAYHHTAIYVGKVKGKHYVIENAGGGGKDEGRWLRLTDIKSAFEDLVDDDSRFFILKPPKSGDTAQRAMAAYKEGFKYKYGLYGFNCETFTSVCAEVEPDSAEVEPDSAEVEPQIKVNNRCQRVLAERADPKRVDKEMRDASLKDQEKYAKKLWSVLGEVQAEIDKGSFSLDWDPERGPVIRGPTQGTVEEGKNKHKGKIN